MAHSSDLPSHASPIITPIARPSSSSSHHHLKHWTDVSDPSDLPHNLISPAFTPPATPGAATPSRHLHSEPHSTPVDTSLDPPAASHPRLSEKLPWVECVVRARIPTTSGTEMFLHLYQNDSDTKEHLAIVFGSEIRSRSLDQERPGESEMDRMIRGAYTGRLRPGRVSSRVDSSAVNRLKMENGVGAGARPGQGRGRSGSALKNVVAVESIDTITEGEVLDTSNGVALSTHSDSDEPPSSITQNSDTQGTPQHNSVDIHQHLENHHLNHQKPPLVRIHSECYTGETAWSARCDCGEQLDEAARLMSLPSSLPTGGVIVYLRQEGRGIGLAEKLKAYNIQDLGSDTVEANLLLRHPADARTYGLATAILCDLGLGTDNQEQHEGEGDEGWGEGGRGIRLLTNNPDKVRAVEGGNKEVKVRERVAMVPVAWRTGGVKGVRGVEIEKYLETKIGRMGHMIHEGP